jgi:TM2 domain-containing membrane protein YozV
MGNRGFWHAGGMTDPTQFGSSSEGTTPPPPGQYPPPPGQHETPSGQYGTHPSEYGTPGQYGTPPGQYPPPGQYGTPPGQYGTPPGQYDPMAPFGRHPMTGEPFSDKSKIVAGLLQLIGLFGLVGIGRIYMGDTKLGVIQLVVGLVTCGIGAVIWGIIDAILILTDKVRDPLGRPLRDGT